MFCKYCGTKLEDKNSVCPNCKKPDSTKKIWLPFWTKVTLFVFGIVFILIGILLIYSNYAEGVVENQLQAIRNGKLTEAYYEYTSKKFQEATSLENFKEFVKSLQPFIEKSPLSKEETPLDNGTKRVRQIFAAQDNSRLILDFILVKEDDDWKILNMKLEPEVEEQNLTENEPVSPIVKLLELLKKNQLKQAYQEETSAQFKAATSLKELNDFLKSFPIFSSYTSYDILDLKKKGKIAQTIVLFHDGHQKIYALFSLSVEGNLWKIHGIEIAKGGNEAPEAFSSEDLINVIQSQLSAIKAGDLKKAYDKFTSKSFREVTPFEAFEKFIKAYPIFSNYKDSNFYKLTFNNNIAVFSGELTSEKNEKREVEFYLDHEEGEWKILQIHISEKRATEKNHASFSTSMGI